jgi:hypothetical protein
MIGVGIDSDPAGFMNVQSTVPATKKEGGIAALCLYCRNLSAITVYSRR